MELRKFLFKILPIILKMARVFLTKVEFVMAGLIYFRQNDTLSFILE